MVDILARYAYLNNAYVKQKPVVQTVERVAPRLEAKSTERTITYPSENIESALLVHHVSDYTKKEVSVLLIPQVTTEIDKLLFSREEVRGCIPTL